MGAQIPGMKSGVYQHNGSLTVRDLARKVSAHYDAKDIHEPFSIIDLDVVKRQLDLWCRALPSVKPFYAVKCNPDPNILRMLSAHGACFDCASLPEMHLILSNGLASGDEIVLAHPVKTRSCIRYALENGITAMTLDSVEELRKITSITADAKLILRIRVTGFESLVDLNKKFGADEATSKLILHEAARLGAKIHGIRVGEHQLPILGEGRSAGKPQGQRTRTVPPEPISVDSRRRTRRFAMSQGSRRRGGGDHPADHGSPQIDQIGVITIDRELEAQRSCSGSPKIQTDENPNISCVRNSSSIE
ncbi:unnamed protein product [Heligmosomoides polygyrus]|uniref:ornithine decarboxylase n=1 Tax=Heligmosomoides polygyrus TaxID=6339 RepID=A0A3P8CXW5_HELPZ|nr:unnamed protein product [Heligmosomoides polygyrus]